MEAWRRYYNNLSYVKYYRLNKPLNPTRPHSHPAERGIAMVLDYCRTSVSALSGATAGILGLAGLYSFISYLLASILLSLLLILKVGRR
ncbi:unnamed protein product [Nyctereutes procyonoides]|uniref:ER membrane protein complex subunit 6 n=1 Tax=Nyctereutes procyonoides TaxID=34880 RepID=A0A811YAW3_NYCPR|nr:unnamed protein product [Nyctereutes procyonoides]